MRTNIYNACLELTEEQWAYLNNLISDDVATNYSGAVAHLIDLAISLEKKYGEDAAQIAFHQTEPLYPLN